jgi:hypothetical protein
MRIPMGAVLILALSVQAESGREFIHETPQNWKYRNPDLGFSFELPYRKSERFQLRRSWNDTCFRQACRNQDTLMGVPGVFFVEVRESVPLDSTYLLQLKGECDLDAKQSGGTITVLSDPAMWKGGSEAGICYNAVLETPDGLNHFIRKAIFSSPKLSVNFTFSSANQAWLLSESNFAMRTFSFVNQEKIEKISIPLEYSPAQALEKQRFYSQALRELFLGNEWDDSGLERVQGIMRKHGFIRVDFFREDSVWGRLLAEDSSKAWRRFLNVFFLRNSASYDRMAVIRSGFSRGDSVARKKILSVPVIKMKVDTLRYHPEGFPVSIGVASEMGGDLTVDDIIAEARLGEKAKIEVLQGYTDARTASKESLRIEILESVDYFKSRALGFDSTGTGTFAKNSTSRNYFLAIASTFSDVFRQLNRKGMDFWGQPPGDTPYKIDIILHASMRSFAKAVSGISLRERRFSTDRSLFILGQNGGVIHIFPDKHIIEPRLLFKAQQDALFLSLLRDRSPGKLKLVNDSLDRLWEQSNREAQGTIQGSISHEMNHALCIYFNKNAPV